MSTFILGRESPGLDLFWLYYCLFSSYLKASNQCSHWLHVLYGLPNSDQSGLRSLASGSRFGAGMITSYFSFESSAIIAYTNLSPSERFVYPGDIFVYIFWIPPSFNTSLISPMNSIICLIAGYTESSLNAGSLSLLSRPLLCRHSLKPANTIVIGFILVWRFNQVGFRQNYHIGPKQGLRGIHKVYPRVVAG